MPKRNWIFVLAVIGLGLALAPIAYAQPIDGDSGSNTAADKGQTKPTHDQEPKPSPTIQNALQHIARILETIANKPESTTERERAERDLKAQEDMAKWAKWMLWIGGVETAVTGFGVFLVWRTLVHTRDAAIHAGAAVIEAKNATRAAEDSVSVTREVGEAQVRAYLAIENPKVTARTDSNCLMISFHVRNLGNSPAKEFNYTYLISFHRVPLPGEEFPPKSYSRENAPQYPNFPANGDRRIKSGGVEVISHLATDFLFTDEEIGYFRENSLWVRVSIANRFKDVFGETIAEIEHFHRLGGVPLDREVGVYPCGYSHHRMADLALE